MNLAECVYEDMPLCLDCADDLLDRQVAISLSPNIRGMLPQLWEK